MAVKEENRVLAEAKELYSQLVAGKKGSGDGILGSLNKAVLDDVSKTVRKPMADVLSTVESGVTSSREVAGSVTGLPELCKKELENVPCALKLDALTGDVPGTVRSVLDTMKAAAADPTMLYPRFVCGSIPVDPAKIASVVNRYNAGGTTAERSAPPGSSAEVISGIAGSFGGVADPLVNGLESLQTIRDKLTKTSEAVREIDGGGKDLDELVEKEGEIGGWVDRLTGMFSSDNPAGEVAERGLGDNGNCMDVVEQGTQLVRSAGDFQGPLERCVEKVKAMGARIASLAEELKSLFKLAMDALKNVVELLKAFIANLPTILDQIRQFFVPSGLRSLIMVTSNDTQNLLSSVEKLKTAVPQPEEVESSARSVLGGSESASIAEQIKEKIGSIIEIPMLLVQKLSQLSSELPGKVIASAKAAVKAWAAEFGADIIGDKIEEGLQGVAGMIGGQKLADAVGDILPFGSDDDKGDEKSSAIANAANGLFQSFL